LGVSLGEILEVYQKMLGTDFESLETKVYLFLDEVQYDDSWALTLKNVYDKTKKVFIVCTGSSALSLQTNPDSTRRISFTRIYPLKFTEYQMIKYKRFPIKGLGNAIKQAIFGSKTAEEVLNALKVLAPKVESYWKSVKPSDLEEYLKYGTLPSSLALEREPLIYPNINQTLNSVLNRDVPQLNTFDKQTIEKLSQILYTVASNDSTSFKKISETVQLDYKTVVSVFDALEKTELLIRVYPLGSHQSQSKKPSKYLFSSPAFRAMYYNIVGSTASFDDYKGKLFEDVIGMYLYRIFSTVPEASMTYDSDQGGADFIVRPGLDPNDNIVLEASLGKKGSRQVVTTLGRVKARYGVVVSTSHLRIDATKQCVAVPLEYFLLI
jgi:predicted AAA+ superfamily ATPase